jgi:hypothetical protein
VTATAELDDELTLELVPCRLLVEAVDVVLVDVLALVVGVDVPGMVAALTTASVPTPATDAKAIVAVRRLRRRVAAARASALAAA